MIELMNVDMWDVYKNYDAVCITTNSIVKSDGELVMGVGVALQAKDRYPDLPKKLGKITRMNGPIVYLVEYPDMNVVSFPTKYHFSEPSDLDLIARSCKQLVRIASDRGWTRVLLPRPGCQNGKLDWNDVREVIGSILDDRFYIVDGRN